eukprot:1186567-Prorocentrum_minimum.AAC.4
MSARLSDPQEPEERSHFCFCNGSFFLDWQNSGCYLVLLPHDGWYLSTLLSTALFQILGVVAASDPSIGIPMWAAICTQL